MSSLFLVPDSVPLLRFPFSESSQSPSRSGRFFSFGIFRAALLFICQGACVFPGRNSITLSQERSVVKTFFGVFQTFFGSPFPGSPRPAGFLPGGRPAAPRRIFSIALRTSACQVFFEKYVKIFFFQNGVFTS